MTTKNKKGFTIIEVVLVLAIAGLIFLMVFIALPALQRSQRNTQREDDLARVLTAVNQYQANNNGKVPFGRGGAEIQNFIVRYIDSQCKNGTWNPQNFTFTGDSACSNEFKDPQGNVYFMRDLGKVGTGQGAVTAGDISSSIEKEQGFYGVANASCGDEGKVVQGTGDRDVAVYMKLEGGAIACNDNH